jgi:hypothetical protein
MKNKMQRIFVFVLSFLTFTLNAQIPEQTTTTGSSKETKIPEVQKVPTPDRTRRGQTTPQSKEKKPKGKTKAEESDSQSNTETAETNEKGKEHRNKGSHSEHKNGKNKDKVKKNKKEDRQDSKEGGYPENRKHNDDDEKREKKGKGC